MTEAPNLLPVVIKVLAAFSKTEKGELDSEEIDAALAFLRDVFPRAVYSELRKLFRQALQEQHDLKATAAMLSKMPQDRKIMLGVQLYSLTSQSGLWQKHVADFFDFMTALGVPDEGAEIVRQITQRREESGSAGHEHKRPLESLSFGAGSDCDVLLKGLGPEERLVAFRHSWAVAGEAQKHSLILLKNESCAKLMVGGRSLPAGTFCQLGSGQWIVLSEQRLTFLDLERFFQAKKSPDAPIYLSLERGSEAHLHKARTRESVLEIKYGLKVRVRALRDVDATLNGVELRAGTVVEAAEEDRLLFHNEAELALEDLRRPAGALGGRFLLKAYKPSYLVSNSPALLDADDILLSPGTSGEILLKIYCNYETKTGRLEVLQCDRPIQVGGEVVRNEHPLKDGDEIRIDAGQFLRCSFSERVIDEERNIVSSLELRDVGHRYRRVSPSLEGVSFSVNRGEMICVMGASGSGKSTLLRTISGQLQPSEGEVLLNGQPLYANLDSFRRFISYIPQDDAFDEYLTIEENLQFAATIRAPHLSGRDRARRIEGKLEELGLGERRGSVVGDPVKKQLSGGERKRLNIGLDMISSADVFLFDEPTSGLSSKDSEHVIEIIRSMAHNKIVLVTIHQPNSKLFQMFSKALLLDKGGKLVFYGTPSEMLSYFAEAEHEEHFGAELGGCPACGTTRPEFIFDVLETPLRDFNGEVIFEENTRGQLVPARRFPPDYWRDRYESFRLLQEMRQMSVAQPPPTLPTPAPHPTTSTIRWRDEWNQLRTLLKRAFLSKLRNRANLILTALVPPGLALLVGGALYFTASGKYDFASAFHIPTYCFIALLVALFLALMNSVDDIVRDRSLLNRERNLDVRLPYYLLAKFGTLTLFSAIQCMVFVLVGNSILEIRGMFWPYFWFMLLTAVSGTTLGLLISALVPDSKAAANFVPLVLIPQLIFGGALIKYEEMNRDLDLQYAFKKWMSNHPEAPAQEGQGTDLSIPWISRLVATHYSYEALIVAQAKLNPLSIRQDRLQAQIDQIVERKPEGEVELARLEELKDTLAVLSGVEGRSPADLDSRLKEADKIIRGKPGIRKLRSSGAGVNVEQLFINQKITDLVSKAETEQSDYRRQHKVNVFFGPVKHWLGQTTSVFIFNSAVLLLSSFGYLCALYLILRHQLRPRSR